MSLFSYKYENELFDDSIKPPPKNIKPDPGYVVNADILPNSKINYNIAKIPNNEPFYIFEFLGNIAKEAIN